MNIDGIISFAGLIDTDDAMHLASDESVALVDVTKSVLETQLRQEYPTHKSQYGFLIFIMSTNNY